MVRRLKVPNVYSGPRDLCHQTIRKQIDADSIRPVEIISRRAKREICDTAFGVDSDLSPGIYSTDVLVCFLRPGVISHFARMGQGVELPYQFAPPDIVGSQITRRRVV